MYYVSSRNDKMITSPRMAVLNGIASDGGLYTDPHHAARTIGLDSIIECDAVTMSRIILETLLPDIENIGEIVKKGYEGKFESEDITPLVSAADRYVLELFRGPTCAFKDIALSLLPGLMVSAKKSEGIQEETVILTATSGDTGKAALEGFKNAEGTRIIVFYPYQGVSKVQEMQMTTQEGSNVCVCAVRGNFDDSQTGVKEIFTRCSDLSEYGARLSSANSINIGRLVPQIMYYFKAYADLVHMGRIKKGDKIWFAVPTGNFGDILAGYMAKEMGLPVERLICASNSNDVLTEFISTGVYNKCRSFYKTSSPSMDILASSNLERLLFMLSGDCNYTAELMDQLKRTGRYKVSDELLSEIKKHIDCFSCSEEKVSETIGKVWKEYGYVCDPHTAVAWAASDSFMDQAGGAPVVVLSTASPFKFPASVVRAMGEEPSEDEFEVMKQLSRMSGIAVPPQLAGLKDKPVRHTEVIEKSEMEEYVLAKISGKGWR